MQSTHTLLCLAAGAGIAIAGAHVRQAIERTTMDPSIIREARASAALDGETQSLPLKVRTIDDLFAAIREVETGGCEDPAHAEGDGGKSLGWLQISYACWADANGADDSPRRESLERLWREDSRSWLASCETARAYWDRHCRGALYANDFQTLARVWNGGPNGAEKESTLAYWSRVRAQLEAMP